MIEDIYKGLTEVGKMAEPFVKMVDSAIEALSSGGRKKENKSKKTTTEADDETQTTRVHGSRKSTTRLPRATYRTTTDQNMGEDLTTSKTSTTEIMPTSNYVTTMKITFCYET